MKKNLKYEHSDLPMSNREILKSYLEAKDKRNQLKILSELNLCSIEKIKDILMAEGVDGRRLPHPCGEEARRKTIKMPSGESPAPIVALKDPELERVSDIEFSDEPLIEPSLFPGQMTGNENPVIPSFKLSEKELDFHYKACFLIDALFDCLIRLKLNLAMQLSSGEFSDDLDSFSTRCRLLISLVDDADLREEYEAYEESVRSLFVFPFEKLFQTEVTNEREKI